MSITNLILSASGFAQAIMIILVLCSLISWAITFSKLFAIRSAKKATERFNLQFRGNDDLHSLFVMVSNLETKPTNSKIFYNAIAELNRMTNLGVNNKSQILNNIERAVNMTIDEETNDLESKLSILATFGSVSPYIGLLGTVWGIMSAFIGLGDGGQATLASVAPGIAEALIATAAGLFVAIPAYIFFNKFTTDVNYIYTKMTRFSDELLNIINRHTDSNND